MPLASKAQIDDARNLQAACGYLDLSMPEHALRALNQVTDPDSDPFEYFRLRGEALRSLDRFEESLASLSRAREEQPDDLSVLLGMAWCYKRTDRLSHAIAAMEEAYQAHPKVPVVLYNMACYYSLAGDKMQALAWLGRALRMEKSLRKRSRSREDAEALETSLRQLIADESDFDPLRQDPDFQYLTSLEHLNDL